MDFSLTDDQQSLRELARKILEEGSTQERQKEMTASEERIDRALWAELARANLLGVAIDEAHDGSGFGLPELLLLLEEVGRAVAPLPVFPTLVLGALPLAAFGSKEQKAQWLPKVAGGEAMLSAALVEEAGSTVTARRAGSDWVLEGERRLVEAAHVAQRILVPARTEGESLGFFLVDPLSEGVSAEKVETTDQHWRSHLRLRGVRVADSDVLGDPAGGAAIRDWLLDRATLALCALQVGVASRALEITAGYVSERRQFDRPIGSFQAVHQRAGDAYVDLQAMRLTLWRALHLMEQGEDARELLAIAKYWASEAGDRVTYACMHLHGGIGVDIDYPIHRYYLWARQIGMHLGTGAAQLDRIAGYLAA